ncbi:MAG: putative lipopolysaccharide biosynthesis protein [Myxococcales bacterium]|nr:putative lipopolysaccharide biosynthesis protein [Myxococcales bacterium]
MCGIFGVVAARDASKTEALLGALFRLSESRGKEASGIAGIAGDTIQVLKSPVPSTELLRTKTYASYVDRVVQRAPVAVIGHSRLVTNGAQTDQANNQPVCVDNIAGVHNGIIVNEDKLWGDHPALTRTHEVDTEVLLRLVRHCAIQQGSFIGGVRDALSRVAGVANVAMFASELDQLTIATNNGSIYYCVDAATRFFAFASEEYILATALAKTGLPALRMQHLAAGTGLVVDLGTAMVQTFPLALSQPSRVTERNGVHRTLDVRELASVVKMSSRPPAIHSDTPPAWFREAEDRNREAVARLRRCVRCVQPETIPFVGLDGEGLCIDCRNYQPIVQKGREALEEILAPHRSRTSRADVLVPLSGGRDSCFALHYIKRVLGLNPIAYTYDWGMVTDLARRNASRLCSALGVEHIIVSADITKKREYIRKNVEAWLRRPDLGIIPLFMAGDKQFFHHAQQLQQRTGVSFQIWGNNRLERSDFKTGFCGFDREGYKDNSLFHLGLKNNLKYVGYYASAFARNPGYVNASIPDTLFSYFLYFLKKNTYLDLYDFVPWDEDQIVTTLIGEYDWEVAPDTKSTWRIGDGTAAFYNYIYWTAAGFSESDTFRSGQVRDGSMSRAKAQSIVDEENRPRYASLNWYCRTIGIDLERTLRVINEIPKLYPV